MSKRSNVMHHEIEKKSDMVLEFKPASGKTRSFKNGYELYTYLLQSKIKHDFEFNEKSGPFFSDWMDRRRSKSTN